MNFDTIFPLITTIFNRLVPDKDKQAQFALDAQKILLEQQKAQAAVNVAEAANPNRKWVTWREVIGYACAASIWYMWIIQPAIVMVSNLMGHPVDPDKLFTINVGDVLMLACGMLGISYVPPTVSFVTDKVRGIKK